jgi:hypothetical protein
MKFQNRLSGANKSNLTVAISDAEIFFATSIRASVGKSFWLQLKGFYVKG